MSKEGIITTSGLNCYGGRVLTSGGILTQFEKNPVLLYMHRRGFDGKTMPIGRIENLRIEGDKLIGTPVFDEKDEFARQIGQKWEDDFLRMFSAGIEILETSTDPEFMLPGQMRPTVTKWKLEEVSIVDIGGNDEALRLSYQGKILNLFSGEDSGVLPILLDQEHAAGTSPKATFNKPKNNNIMNKEILELLGLSETASEQDAVNALRLLKVKADQAESLQLASINSLVDGAIADKRITADKKEHFVHLGKSSGIEVLRTTLELMVPQRKPMDVIHPESGHVGGHQSYAKLSDVPASEVPSLKESNPTEYARLYKAEYGVEV